MKAIHADLTKKIYDDSIAALHVAAQLQSLQHRYDKAASTIRKGDSLVALGDALIHDKVVYVVRLRVKTVHHNLSISDAIKDEANAYEFEMPVDKLYFKSLTVGQLLQENTRTGSIIMNGSFGSDEIHVVGKRIAVRN
jgi:hypothetical protein